MLTFLFDRGTMESVVYLKREDLLLQGENTKYILGYHFVKACL